MEIFRIIECFVDHYSFKESGEMRSELCAGICLTGDPSILLRVQVEKVVVGAGGPCGGENAGTRQHTPLLLLGIRYTGQVPRCCRMGGGVVGLCPSPQFWYPSISMEKMVLLGCQELMTYGY